MTNVVNVIKNKGQRQPESFSREKLRNSIIAACLGVYTPEGQAELIADNVCDAVISWIAKRPEVTSHDIRTITVKNLAKHHPEATYLYEQHHIII